MSPASPKVQPVLSDWQGTPELETELRDCLVADKSFASSKRLLVEGCKLKAIGLTSARFDKLEVTDTFMYHIEAAGMRSYGANFLRSEIADCRFTGADFAEAQFEDCIFKNVKFDEAGFRFVTFKRVRFENCVLRQADFSSAKLSHVSFEDCELEDSNFANGVCGKVDLGNENLTNVKGVLGLKGANISDEQLIQIAPLLAVELGFKLSEHA